MSRVHPASGLLDRALQALTAGPAHPERVFLLPDVTYRRVYAMAAALFPVLAGADAPVCLCAENRAVVAAALIAALWTRRPLVLPHAASGAALAQMHRRIDFSLAVVDGERPLPAGVEPVVPAPAAADTETAPFAASSPAPGIEWLRLFTGGSTGRPQIWSKTVANLLGEAAYQADSFGYTPDDRVVATVPSFHIYGLLYSVLAPLVAAAAVSSETPSYPREIAAACDTGRATILVSVPVHYRAMKETGVFCRGLRVALSSAGPLDPADADAFYEDTGTGVTEIYGSTETGGIATRCRAAGQQGLHPFPVVGWKIDAGNLYVRSEFLSPELPVNGEGFFRTGDRAVAIDQGGFSLLGREDGVVKVGGQRVDTEEIREHLRSFSGVRDAWVVSLPSESGRQAAIGALVEGNIDPIRLRACLVEQLEPPAVPRRIRVVGKIPVTAAGKFDREKALKMLIG